MTAALLPQRVLAGVVTGQKKIKRPEAPSALGRSNISGAPAPDGVVVAARPVIRHAGAGEFAIVVLPS